MRMSMEHWWPGPDRAQQKYSEKNWSSDQDYNQSALHKDAVATSEENSVLPLERPTGECVYEDKRCLF